MKTITTIILLASGYLLVAQPTGFWEVTKVSMGDQTMTPIAKWTKIHEDGTYESGNGWLQNSAGTWTYDEQSAIFTPKETNGLVDPFGGFDVEMSNNGMTWKREEEGATVTVSWRSIEILPMAPADQIKGLWDLTGASRKGQDILQEIDPAGIYNMHIKWTRLYTERSSNGKGTGYWFMHAHRPELTMMSHNPKENPIQSWMISFEEDQMVWTGNSDANKGMILTYSRLSAYPN